MRSHKGYAAGHDGQAVVTADQVIAGAMLSRHPAGRTVLHPLPGPCRDQWAAAGIRPELRTVLAGAGYASGETFARAEQDKLRLLAPLAKDPGRRGTRRAARARHLDQYPATARAIGRMRHPRGREDYKLRARTAQPVSGQLKARQELSMMSRRGLAACESEWLPACTARNLRKLHRHRTGR
jgi:hypothetical protein